MTSQVKYERPISEFYNDIKKIKKVINNFDEKLKYGAATAAPKKAIPKYTVKDSFSTASTLHISIISSNNHIESSVFGFMETLPHFKINGVSIGRESKKLQVHYTDCSKSKLATVHIPGIGHFDPESEVAKKWTNGTLLKKSDKKRSIGELIKDLSEEINKIENKK